MGGALEAGYEAEHVRLRCTDCEDFLNRFPFPPGTLDQFDADELPYAFDRWLRALLARGLAGSCPNCAGRLDGRLDANDDPDRPVRLRHGCERCGDVSDGSPTVLPAHHPAGVAFYHDHGLDVTETPSWELAGEVAISTERLGEDPVRARVTAPLDGERLVATIDADASVSDAYRETVEDAR